MPNIDIGPIRALASKRLKALISDSRGAVMVEYTVLIGAIALTGSLGLIVVGTAVARNFEFVRGLLLSPIP